MSGFDAALFFSNLIPFMIVLLLAISCHEAAHAWVSHKFGDDTALDLGRVTLNPVSHTDPLGTLAIPIIGFIFGAAGGLFAAIPLIGWGKPTPVNPSNWTNYKWGNFSVSVAGVIANLILLIIGIGVAKILMMNGFEPGDFFGKSTHPFAVFVRYLMTLNLSLFLFNLIPIPPLDGGKILSSFVPESVQEMLDVIEQYGFIILLMLMALGAFRFIFNPFFEALMYTIYSI